MSDMGRPVLAALAVVGIWSCILLTGCGASARGGSHSPSLSTRLSMPTRTVKAGGQLVGQIVVENDTGHPIHTYACGAIFQVLLTTATYKPTPNWLTCLTATTIPRGRTSYPVTVRARYNQCQQTGGGGGSPLCASFGDGSSLDTGSGPPPLPPGEYEATTFEQGTALPVPAAVAIRVTSA